MGCATSKPKVCHKCQEPYSPVRRSYSLHAYHPPQKDGDSYHMVALTSSTLGSLKLDLLDHQNYHPIIEEKEGAQENRGDIGDLKLSKEEFAMGVVEARTWSKMIDEKIPKIVPRTPVRTPPGEPETINAWELMEGLEDTSPLKPAPFHHIRSFSFHLGSNQYGSFAVDDQPTPRVQENGESITLQKPLWLGLADNESNCNSNDTSIVSEFDPEVISTFRKALEELPPANPFHLKPVVGEKVPSLDGKDPVLEVPEHDDGDDHHLVDNKEVKGSSPHGKDKLIVYFTSLRGVRKTYEDCCAVRGILKGLGVKVDERDVSMHSGFKDELKELLGEEWPSKGALPKVFLGRKFLGGVDEIKRLNEDGQLEEVVEGCGSVDDGGGGGRGAGNGGPCEACGDVRFVPCETCSGSCKIYYEGDYDEDDDEDAETGFQRCPDCNENGLIRCPICCD